VEFYICDFCTAQGCTDSEESSELAEGLDLLILKTGVALVAVIPLVFEISKHVMPLVEVLSC
jgi:hypothetical protein